MLDYPGYIETQDGVSLDPDADDPCYSGRGEVHLTADPTGRLGTSFNASRIVEGRHAATRCRERGRHLQGHGGRLGIHPG